MEKLVVIVGQTSSGKSSLGIFLANEFDGEIVSADSRQVYKGLDYCSGKVDENEQKMAVHHLLDVTELGNQFTLFDFQKKAYEAIDDIIARGKVPFLVGGTGLYTRAVVEGYNLSELPVDEKRRRELEKLSIDELKTICEKKNIELPSEITKRRLVRFLEKSEQNIAPNKPRYDVLQIGIRWSREEIYNRIKLRLEMRMPHMIEETKRQLASGVSKEFLISLGLESKNIIKYLDGEFESYEAFFEELFKEERHFAKRQQTWYNKEKNIVWIDADENLNENAKREVEKFLKN
mgnify:FL=1